jgi:hypothetical protein
VEEDLTPEMMEGVTVHYAATIEDVLTVALPHLKAQPAQNGRAVAPEQPGGPELVADHAAA